MTTTHIRFEEEEEEEGTHQVLQEVKKLRSRC